MPRKSAASQLVPVPNTAPIALQPRPGTPETVATVFREIVASVSPSHFAPGDRLLLEELARSVVLCRHAGDQVARDGLYHSGEIHPLCKVLQKERNIVALLATRLRLTPQSRLSKERAGTTAAKGAPSFDFRGLP